MFTVSGPASVLKNGALFEAVTVTLNVRFVVFRPSLAVIVIVVLPLASNAGANVTVRLAPLPPSVTVGSSVVSAAAAETVTRDKSVSGSLTVKGIADEVRFLLIV